MSLDARRAAFWLHWRLEVHLWELGRLMIPQTGSRRFRPMVVRQQ